jgi:galactonate dehydratase
VHELLGGPVRERIRVYSWIGGDRPADTAKAARAAVEHGFTAVKMNGTEEMHFVDNYAKVERVLERGGVDIIQPDPSHAGGITETRKIAAMAEAYDVALALHCPLGPIALAANLQLDAVCHNAFIQEQSLGIHYNAANDLLDYVVDRNVFAYEGGYVAIPGGPGLGIEINEAYVSERAKVGHRWRNPLWRHDDGSVAEW